MRRTKIVCTIGPSSDSPKVIERMCKAGMNVARLNFSHGTLEGHKQKLRNLRKAATKVGVPLAVMQDLCGPKIRTGELPGKGIRLKPGKYVILSGRPEPKGEDTIPVNYVNLAKDVQAGDTILLADGTIELRVKEVDKKQVRCRVVVGGVVGSHKGVNIPSNGLSIGCLTAKDREDIQFAVKEEIDFVALSFIRKGSDVKKLKSVLAKAGSKIPVIAKIEKPQALEDIDNIIDVADGIMVARGDLGVEIPFQDVPSVQKELIRKANHAGKPVITATQMLRSMVESSRPTRAEVTDVASAIWDGTDALMLSEETASGRFPVEAVKVMSNIASSIEEDIRKNSILSTPYPVVDPMADAISYSVYQISDGLKPDAIVTPTLSGVTARRVSRYRPNAPIVALTPRQETERRLCMSWGTFPILTPDLEGRPDITEQALLWAKMALGAKKGHTVVITAGSSHATPGMTDTVRLARI